MANAQIVPANRRGGVILLNDNYRFVRNKKGRNNMIWRCTETGCGAYLHTNLFDINDDAAVINGK